MEVYSPESRLGPLLLPAEDKECFCEKCVKNTGFQNERQINRSVCSQESGGLAVGLVDIEVVLVSKLF